jgi:hypothetical protein
MEIGTCGGDVTCGPNIKRIGRRLPLILDVRFVDFRTGFVDHHHASTLAAVIEVNSDLMRDQVGGFPGFVLVLAIQPDWVFESDAVGDIKMKNGHCAPP